MKRLTYLIIIVTLCTVLIYGQEAVTLQTQVTGTLIVTEGNTPNRNLVSTSNRTLNK